jgi:hypothetical protein
MVRDLIDLNGTLAMASQSRNRPKNLQLCISKTPTHVTS